MAGKKRPQEEHGVTGSGQRVHTPSQAEGDRATVDRNIEWQEQRDKDPKRAKEQSQPVVDQDDQDTINTPSQAEGDLETIERDLEQKSRREP